MTPESTLDMSAAAKLDFPVLSDVGNKTARAYGLEFVLPAYLRPVYEKFGIDIPTSNGEDTFKLPVPATYVIDQDGIIRWAHVDLDYRTRAEPSDILEALVGLGT
jgi:peroxiredoxin